MSSGERSVLKHPDVGIGVPWEEVLVPGKNAIVRSCVTITLVAVGFSGGGAFIATPWAHPGVGTPWLCVPCDPLGVHVTPPNGEGLNCLLGCAGKNWGINLPDLSVPLVSVTFSCWSAFGGGGGGAAIAIGRRVGRIG